MDVDWALPAQVMLTEASAQSLARKGCRLPEMRLGTRTYRDVPVVIGSLGETPLPVTEGVEPDDSGLMGKIGLGLLIQSNWIVDLPHFALTLVDRGVPVPIRFSFQAPFELSPQGIVMTKEGKRSVLTTAFFLRHVVFLDMESRTVYGTRCGIADYSL
jgi:hypothetical protein